VATPSKAEADKLAAKVKEFQPRVEAADVTGKGRMYRVRVGAYATRPEAEKALEAISGKVGTKGLVVAAK
jgi:cell division septation protein DedD